MLNLKQFRQVKEHLKLYGGATLKSNGTITALKSGYMVSRAGYEKTMKKLSYFKLVKHLRTAQRLGAYAGLWEDNGLIYLDISDNIALRERAILEGLKNNQLSIYDCKNADYIRLK